MLNFCNIRSFSFLLPFFWIRFSLVSYISKCFILVCSDMDCLHGFVWLGFNDNLLLKYENDFTRSLGVVYPLPKLSYSIFAGCYMYCTYIFVPVYVYIYPRLGCSGLCLARYIYGVMRGIWASLSCFT